MPYTRNTRIKITHHKHKTSYVAEVEYVYPILGIKVWEEIDGIERSLFDALFMKGQPIPYTAACDCWRDPELKEVTGLPWAKALIDQYHKLYDEAGWKPIVEYIKYPE